MLDESLIFLSHYRWFKHFYLFSVPYSTFYLSLLCYRYLFNGGLPNLVIYHLRTFLNTPRDTVTAEHALLAMIVFTIHCWKRFYESYFISIFSDTTMHISIYLIGLFHYFGAVISIVGETQHIDKGKKK